MKNVQFQGIATIRFGWYQNFMHKMKLIYAQIARVLYIK